jgi:hypothetical protein
VTQGELSEKIALISASIALSVLIAMTLFNQLWWQS